MRVRVRALSVNFGWSLCGDFLKLPFSSDQMRVSKKRDLRCCLLEQNHNPSTPLSKPHAVCAGSICVVSDADRKRSYLL